MGLFEDLNSGKFNLILFGIIFVLLFHQYLGKSTENMADVGIDIKEAIKQVYVADVEAIRNLSNVATKLQAGGLTIPGDLTIKGKISVETGRVELGKKEVNMWALNVNQTDDGTFSLGRIGRDGKPNENIGLRFISSADGTQNLGGVFSLIPKGTVVAWSGDKAPNGWALCDGANGTPDLRGRFVLGFGSKDRKLGDIGGAEEHTLKIDELPKHFHKFDDAFFSEKTSDPGNTRGTKYLNSLDGYNFIGSGDTDRDNRPIFIPDRQTNNDGGGDKPHNNMPPYYVLAYIIKL